MIYIIVYKNNLNKITNYYSFIYRRINYGNMTHINVTVSVQENNKAVISVAVDRSDRNYYACDGGCLDEPVLLG